MFDALPNAELAVVPGTSHFLTQEKPHLVNALVLDFLTNEPVADRGADPAGPRDPTRSRSDARTPSEVVRLVVAHVLADSTGRPDGAGAGRWSGRCAADCSPGVGSPWPGRTRSPRSCWSSLHHACHGSRTTRRHKGYRSSGRCARLAVVGRLIVHNAMTVNGAYEAPVPEPGGLVRAGPRQPAGLAGDVAGRRRDGHGAGRPRGPGHGVAADGGPARLRGLCEADEQHAEVRRRPGPSAPP